MKTFEDFKKDKNTSADDIRSVQKYLRFLEPKCLICKRKISNRSKYCKPCSADVQEIKHREYERTI